MLVILHCLAPREKLWGVLIRLDAVGVVMRALDLNSVEDWMAQERLGKESMIAPTTLFVPSHRVERIYLDEGNGPVESLGERYRSTCGGDPVVALMGPAAQVPENELQ